ncbi:MAG: hypothetical protein ACYCVH_12840 [Ignavibacteriaceae bacterium]
MNNSKLLISKEKAREMLDTSFDKIQNLIANNEIRLFNDYENGFTKEKVYVPDLYSYIERILEKKYSGTPFDPKKSITRLIAQSKSK